MIKDHFHEARIQETLNVPRHLWGGEAEITAFALWANEAVYVIERMVDILAQHLGMDKAEIRAKNFIRKEQFPYTSAFGFEYDSGDYQTALDKVELRAVCSRVLSPEETADAVVKAREALGYPFEVSIVPMDEISRGPTGKFEEFLSLVDPS